MGLIWLRVLVNPVCFFILYLIWEAFVLVGWLLAVQEGSSGGWITKEPFLCFWQQNIFCHLQSMHTSSEASLAYCSVHAQGKAARSGSDPLISRLVPVLRTCGSVCLYIVIAWCMMTLEDDCTWCVFMFMSHVTDSKKIGHWLLFKVMYFFTSNSDKMLFQVVKNDHVLVFRSHWLRIELVCCITLCTVLSVDCCVSLGSAATFVW